MGGLAQILDPIGSFMGSILGPIWEVITGFVGIIGEFVTNNIIEPVMNFLGFTDEDIYSTDVIAVKVFNEDFYEKTQLELALNYMKEDTGALKYAVDFADTGDKQFGKFYRHGKWYYLDYLPSAQIHACSIPTDKVQAIIENEIGEDIFIRDIIVMVPYDVDWCKYQLQQLYGYDIGSDSLLLDDVYYKYDSYVYNSTANNFSITLSSTSTSAKIDTYRITTIRIVATDEEEELDTIHTTISEYKIYTRLSDGALIDRTDPEIVEDYTEDVEMGSVEAGTSISLHETEEIDEDTIYQVLTVPNHNNIRVYNVKYATTNDGKYHYWMYDPTTNLYPNISTPVEVIEGFEMYPIVMLRNRFWNVSDYDKEGDKPYTITEERYLDTIDILHSVGVDLDELVENYSENADIDKLQDAFFMIGVSPSDDHWSVSAVLYEMFDFIYDKMPYTDTESSYAASFKEDPYNAAISWKPQPTVIKPEVIGGVGTYKHTINTYTQTVNTYTVTTTTRVPNAYRTYQIETYTLTETTGDWSASKVSDTTSYTVYDEWDDEITYTEGTVKELTKTESHNCKDLVLKKQLSATETKTITLQGVTSFNIIRRGVDNGGVSLQVDDPDLVLPLPVPVVERLTLIQKCALLSRSVYLLFYAFEHRHLEWYQTSKFASFLQIISICITVIVTIFTFGTGSGASMTFSSMLWAALKAVAIGAALQLALQLIMTFVEDTHLKMFLAVAAMVVAMYAGGAFDEFSFITAVQLADLPVKAFEIFTNDKVMDLAEDISSFFSTYEERAERNKEILEGLQSSVETSTLVDLAVNADDAWLNRGATLLTPSQFYNMAVGSYRNYDVLYSGFYDNSVHNFVSNRLTLGLTGE